MKPGYLTSEFWLVAAALGLAAAGLIEDPAIAIVAGVYAGARGIAKHGQRPKSGKPWWVDATEEEI